MGQAGTITADLATVWRLVPSANSTITGIGAAGSSLAAGQGRYLQILNGSATKALTLAYENSGSSAPNRFSDAQGRDVVLEPGELAWIWYRTPDTTSGTATNARWVVLQPRVHFGGATPSYSCAGATVVGNDRKGVITTPDTSCVLTFTKAYLTNPPACTANASSAIAVGVSTSTTAATFVMASKPTSMTYSCDGVL